MPELTLTEQLSDRIADLYQRMEEQYDQVAGQIGLTCDGCPDNCCDSFFRHHTFAEWAYLWEGLRVLPAERLTEIRNRAELYMARVQQLILADEPPLIMCPVNEKGRCAIYRHRMMICRLHGVPAAITRPDGEKMQFPGCFRCQEMTTTKTIFQPMERGGLFQEMIAIETEIRRPATAPMPKIKMTLAEMIINGPPKYK